MYHQSLVIDVFLILLEGIEQNYFPFTFLIIVVKFFYQLYYKAVRFRKK